jgi:hypothetical protein
MREGICPRCGKCTVPLRFGEIGDEPVCDRCFDALVSNERALFEADTALLEQLVVEQYKKEVSPDF